MFFLFFQKVVCHFIISFHTYAMHFLDRNALDARTRVDIRDVVKPQPIWVFVPCDHQVLDLGLERVLVLEDDVRFEPRFKRRLQAIMDDIDKAQLDWDLM